MFMWRAKQIQIIGNPDNQHLDKWNSAVFCALCNIEIWSKNLVKENTILTILCFGAEYKFLAKKIYTWNLLMTSEGIFM
jgi:hypothetical protein